MLPEDGEQGDLATAGRRIQVRAVVSTSSGIVPAAPGATNTCRAHARALEITPAREQMLARTQSGCSSPGEPIWGICMHESRPSGIAQVNLTLPLTKPLLA